MIEGYRYECAWCRAVGIRHADGVIRAYSDNGQQLRAEQERDAWDADEWRRHEEARAREAREMAEE